MMPFDAEAMVLYKDDDLLVVNKPAGLLSLPDGYDPQKPHLKSLLEPLFGRLWTVHRLDRETSGVMVLARTAEAHRALNTQFEQRLLEKVYHALVVGIPAWTRLDINLRLRAGVGRRHRTVVDARHGKSAETTLGALQQFADYSLVEAIPRTGRPHQVRVHLAASGHPVIADALYGKIDHPSHRLLGRLGLHALALSFEHPTSGLVQRFEAPYPDDFASLLTPTQAD